MAFAGTPVITSLGHNIVRVSGVLLTGNTTGTIGPVGSGAEVILPAPFPTTSGSATLTMSDLVMISFTVGDVGGVAEATHLHVDKTASPLVVTFSNDTLNASGPLDIYVVFWHSMVR